MLKTVLLTAIFLSVVIPIQGRADSLISQKLVSAGQSHTCSVSTDDRVWCWGYNSVGQLGLGDNVDRFNPTEISVLAGRGVQSISIAGDSTFALDQHGQIWAWGDNTYGQLGIGNFDAQTVPTLVPGFTGHTVTKLAAINSRIWVKKSPNGGGSGYDGPAVCALIDGKSVWCWGNQSMGRRVEEGTRNYQYADPQERLLPNAEEATDFFFTSPSWADIAFTYDGGGLCVTTQSRRLYCYHFKSDSYLALLPDPIPVAVQGLPREDLVTIVTMRNSIYALTKSGTVWTWSNSPGSVAVPLEQLKNLRVKSLVGSSISVFAITTQDTVFSWGFANLANGNSGTEDPTLVPELSGKGISNVYVDTDYSSSGSVNCANFTDGSLSCWGANMFGQLALGSKKKQFLPKIVANVGLVPVAVFVRGTGVCGIERNGLMKCWGLNNYGQLGIGTIGSLGDDPSETYEAFPYLEF